APFGEVPLDLPLTPAKLLGVIEGRPIAKLAETSVAISRPVVEVATPQVAEPARESAVVIDGSWKMVLATPMGPQPMTGRFETQGKVLKGSLESDQGSQDFEGTVIGNLLKWEMKVTKPMPLTLKYELLVDGDTISGKAKLGIFGTAKVTGRRG
ncbi:MAG TPA: hypothetical protein VIU34_29470, partial [Steroidobacter sp.]